jgi:hypothetical protein
VARIAQHPLVEIAGIEFSLCRSAATASEVREMNENIRALEARSK